MRKKISLYYHIWSPDGTDLWKLMVDEQLKRIYRNDLPEYASIYCAIIGSQAHRISEYVSMYDWVNILDVTIDESKYEGLTLEKLYEETHINEDLQAVGYMHTKGISHMCGVRDHYSDRKFRAVNSWRHQLEWGILDRWKEAVDKLNEYQVTGTNHCIDPWPHMSGNFWWARPDYVKTLIHPTRDSFTKDSRDFGPIQRMNYEKWIGLNNPSFFSFYNAPFSYDHKGMIPDITPKPGEPNWFWQYRDDIEPYYRKGDNK